MLLGSKSIRFQSHWSKEICKWMPRNKITSPTLGWCKLLLELSEGFFF